MIIPHPLPPNEHLDELPPEILGCLLLFELREREPEPSFELAKSLIDAGASLDLRFDEKIHDLHQEHKTKASENRFGDFRDLWFQQIPYGLTSPVTGWSALHFAADHNLIDIAKLLISNGADINAQDHKLQTPLYKAIWNPHVEMIKLLIDLGADLEVVDHMGRTPLGYACYYNQLESIEILLNAGASKTDRDHWNKMPWNHANQEIQSKLPELRPDTNLRPNTKRAVKMLTALLPILRWIKRS